MKINQSVKSLVVLLIGALALVPEASLAASANPGSVTESIPAMPAAVQIPPVAIPAAKAVPGAGLTLTQPVNVLQPIPPVPLRIPGLSD